MTAGDDAARAIALYRAGRSADAAALCREILARGEEHPQALHLLGLICFAAGERGEAVDLVNRAVAANPGYAQAEFNLAVMHAELGRLAEAAVHYQRAAELNPEHALAWSRLGAALVELARPLDAERAFRLAVRLDGNDAATLTDLAYLTGGRGQLDEAIEFGRRAVTLAPSFNLAYLHLGRALADRGDFDDSGPAFPAAFGTPRAEAWSALAMLWGEAGFASWATAALRGAAASTPDDPQLRSALICAEMLDPQVTPTGMRDTRRAWAERFADPLTADVPPSPNDRAPNRRLRLGYVMAGVCRYHTGAMVLLPVIEAHARDGFEIYCYSDVPAHHEDAVTARFRRATTYRQTDRLSDEELAAQIRRDRIDIVVETFGHPKGSRLLAVARKPAPVQICFPTMGSDHIRAIDYTLGDPTISPRTEANEFSERVVRLPVAYAFECLTEVPPVDPACPFEANGYVTFGSFNRLSKVSDPLLAAWSRILAAVPNSRLVIKPGPSGVGTMRWFSRRLRTAGIDEGRVNFLPPQESHTEHLMAYRQTDIILDSFPYGGVTTTCEALLMGVPVIGWASDRALGRYTASFLSQLHLSDLAANSMEEYVAAAAALAADSGRLRALRRDLRGRFQASRMYGGRLARDLERVYRATWRRYAASREAR
jgi:predicted O-linked N-acetylglucosamine transferase (SPINDLY family)